MRYVDCSCGLNYDAQAGLAGCPRCGNAAGGGAVPAPAGADAKIRFPCPRCGLRLTAGAASIGKSMDCLACGKPAIVPAASAPDTVRSVSTVRRPAPVAKPASRPDGWRSIARWSLLAALIPLGIFTFSEPDDIKQRIEDTKIQYPELARRIDGGSKDEVLEMIPSHRIVGAALAQKTSAHWIVAILAALIFWEFILIVQPMGNSTSKQLWAVGFFTGTIGIMMLLIVTITGIVAAALNIPVLKYLGYSYGAATDPNNGFIPSMIGFTIGVGFLEELCKAFPLYWHYRKSGTLDARGAVVWGLATGIGFGVSEGISYSGSFYNGVYGGGIYVVRFISCVALHAIWSATVAILIWRRQDSIQRLSKGYQWFPILLSTLASSMIIHGFYDTCIKKAHGIAALLSAILSFALFFWMYDRACRDEKSGKTAASLA